MAIYGEISHKKNSFIKYGWNSGYKTFKVHSSCSLQVSDQCLKTRYFDFASLQSTLQNITVFLNARWLWSYCSCLVSQNPMLILLIISEVCLERVRYRIFDIVLWVWNIYFPPFNAILYWYEQTILSWQHQQICVVVVSIGGSCNWSLMMIRNKLNSLNINSMPDALRTREMCCQRKQLLSHFYQTSWSSKTYSNGPILVSIEDLCLCPREREWLLPLVYDKKAHIDTPQNHNCRRISADVHSGVHYSVGIR